MVHLAFKTRLIFSSKEDEQKLFEMLESQRFAVNECSKVKFNSKIYNSIKELHHIFYKNFRLQHFYIPAQIVIRAEQECLSNYRSIKSNKHQINEPLEKENLSIQLDKHLYSFKNNKFRITTLKGRISCDYEKYDRLDEMMKQGHKLCDPTLFVKDNEIFISFIFEVETELVQEKLALGIDLGIRRSFATSDGKIFIDKEFNKRKRKVRYLKRKLRSKGTKSAKRKLKQMRRKERNMNKNQTHLIVNEILKTEANIIVFEDLKSLKQRKEKKKHKNLNKISQVPFYKIKEIAQYKAPLRNKMVKTVSAAFTSQIDSRTGKKEGVRRGCRFLTVDGKTLDADINAAVNIAIRSNLPILQNRNKLLHGQADVIQPNTSEKRILFEKQADQSLNSLIGG